MGIGPTKVVEFGLASTMGNVFGGSRPSLDAALSISIENVSKYLDTNTLKVKTHTLQEYVNGKISEISQLSSSSSGVSLKYLKDSATTIAGNPAWKIAYTSSFGGIPSLYETTTYIIKDNKLYTFDYFSDLLKVPETLPVAQKIIDSFQFAGPAVQSVKFGTHSTNATNTTTNTSSLTPTTAVANNNNKNNNLTTTATSYNITGQHKSAQVAMHNFTSSAESTTNYVNYKDPQGRFSVDYPSGWHVNSATNRFETTLADFYSVDLLRN